MPRLRRLSGEEVIRILKRFGYEVIRVKGSHYRLKLDLGAQTCFTTVPVHGKKPLAAGTLQAIYRQVTGCIPEEDLRPEFYAE